MNGPTKRFFYSTLFLLLLLLTLSANAQYNLWEPEDGVMVRQGHHIFWMMSGVATDDDGNFVVTWSDAHTGAQNIYAQKYDEDGNTLWGDEPVVVSSGEFAQQNPSVFYVGDDQWLIAWQDHRNDENKWGRYQFAIQRLDAIGSTLWNEDILVTENGYDYFNEIVLTCEDGDVIILSQHNGYRELRADRITPAGEFAWENNEVVMDTAYSFSADITTDDNLVIAWQKADARIYYQSFSPEGNALWNEGEPVLLAEDAINYDPITSVVSDENSGVYITLELDSDDSFVGQHIDSEGNVLWGDEGAVLIADVPISFDPCCIVSPDGDLFVVYKAWHYTNNYTGCQRYTIEEGLPVAQWGEDECGITFELESGDFFGLPHVTLNSNAGILFTTIIQDWSQDNPYSIAIFNLDEDGGYAWEGSNPIMFETDDPPCANSQEPVLVNGTPYIFWRDMRPNAGGIFFNSLDPANGNIERDEPVTVISGIDHHTYGNCIVRSGESAYVSWVDWRYSDNGLRVCMQRLDFASGESMWEANGINVSEPGDVYADVDIYDTKTEICPDGNGGAYVFYSLMDEYYCGDLVVRRIDESGNMVWGEDAVTIADASFEEANEYRQSNPFLLEDGTVLNIFSKASSFDWYLELVAQQFNQDGDLLLNDGVPVTMIAYDDADVLVGDILMLDNETIAIAFILHQGVTRSFNLQLFNTNGEALWDEPVALNSEASYHYYDISLSQREDRIICAWHECTDSDVIRAVAYQYDGTPAWENPVEIAVDYGINELVLVDKWDGEFWLCWQLDTENEIYYQQFTFEGAALLEPYEGQLLELETPEDYYRYDFQGVSDEAGGMYLFWTENYQNSPSDLGYVHLLADGSFATEDYIGYGACLTDAIFWQTDLATVPDGEGGVLTAWTDYRGSGGIQEGDDVYAMRVCDYQFSGMTDKTIEQPLSWELHNAYPNPFNPSTTLSFTAPRTSEVTLAIYDVLGRKVATLMDGVVQAGRQQVIWQGHSDQGMPVASGTYFVRLEGDGVNLTRKMIMLK